MTSNAGVAHSMVQYTHQLVGSHLQYTYRKGRKKASVLTRFMSTWLKLEIFGESLNGDSAIHLGQRLMWVGSADWGWYHP